MKEIASARARVYAYRYHHASIHHSYTHIHIDIYAGIGANMMFERSTTHSPFSVHFFLCPLQLEIKHRLQSLVLVIVVFAHQRKSGACICMGMFKCRCV